MRRKTLLALLTLLVTASPAFPQALQLEKDARIRTTVGRVKNQFRFQELRSDSLVVVDDRDRTLVLALRDLDSLEVRTGHGSTGNEFLKGAGWGFLLGGIIGVVLGYADGDDPPGFLAQTADEKAAMGGVVLGVVGALVGGIRALIVGADTWDPVPLPEIARKRTSELRQRERHDGAAIPVVAHVH